MITWEDVERERDQLRGKQAKKVMKLIGGMLDAWEGLPNDLKQQIEAESVLGEYLDKIDAAMESAS